MYFYFIIPWHDVRNAIADIHSARSAMVRSTGMVITRRGLFNQAVAIQIQTVRLRYWNSVHAAVRHRDESTARGGI